MKKTDSTKYKKALLSKRAELSAPKSEASALIPGAGGPQGDLIDHANADTEAELQVRLHHTDGRLLRAIDEALARINQGAFGVCTSCKRPISKTRLKAVPWTRLCLRCKENDAH